MSAIEHVLAEIDKLTNDHYPWYEIYPSRIMLIEWAERLRAELTAAPAAAPAPPAKPWCQICGGDIGAFYCHHCVAFVQAAAPAPAQAEGWQPTQRLRNAVAEYQAAALARPGDREVVFIPDGQKRAERFCDAVNELLAAAMPPSSAPDAETP